MKLTTSRMYNITNGVGKEEPLLVSKLYFPKAIKTYIVSGRSSDLLPCLNAFPFRSDGIVAKVVVQHVSGAYSSGSVQDLHLIPFSSITSKPFEVTKTKISVQR